MSRLVLLTGWDHKYNPLCPVEAVFPAWPLEMPCPSSTGSLELLGCWGLEEDCPARWLRWHPRHPGSPPPLSVKWNLESLSLTTIGTIYIWIAK